MTALSPLIFAVPKGRILKELLPLLESCGIVPEDDFFDDASRKLRFATSVGYVDLIRVRAFDVATMVAYGGADFGVVGSDVIEEFDYPDLYAPLDLGIGGCRLSLAGPDAVQKDALFQQSHVRVATKYPNITARYFAKTGIQADCIKLNGAMEIAPALGMANLIVDLVSTGSTLKANALQEIDTVCDVSAKLVVNRHAMKTKSEALDKIIHDFAQVLVK